MSSKMIRNNTATDIDNAGMGHGTDIDSSLPSTIDSAILSDDVDNIIPSRSTAVIYNHGCSYREEGKQRLLSC
jgi:hypothetical protein